MKTTTILLINFGGPENQTQIKKFLYQLFADTDAIQMPLPQYLQKFIARIIAHFRTKSSRKKYEHIGGKSPLPEITASLSKKISALIPYCHVEYAMRYGEPSIKKILTKMSHENHNPDYIISLYPHYSYATTFSIEQELQKIQGELHKINHKPILKSAHLIRSWYEHPDYIKLLSGLISNIRKEYNSDKEVLYLFCAHGIPLSYIRKGDPYPGQIRKQMSLITKATGLEKNIELAWQSRTGPGKWLEPDCETIIDQYAKKGFKKLVLIPLSFICDNLETLWDLDTELQKTALESGFESYYRIPAPNDSEAFAAMLLKLCTGDKNNE